MSAIQDISRCAEAMGSAASLRLRAACRLLLSSCLFLPVAGLWAQTPTPVPIPTWRYDLSHAGANTYETELNTNNVNVNTFGKLFSLPVDGLLYAQPLYIPGLKMSDGQVHNVLFVATSHDSVYAFDADNNGGTDAKPIWQISLLSTAHGAGPGATTVPWQDTGSPDVGEIGITGTPVINPATNTLYVVAETKENGQYFSRLHAINILTGAEQPNSPVVVSATVAGTGHGSSGGQLAFSALWENQRTALDYYNGYVYFGYAAHGDNGPWHGWLFAYNATTLAQTAAICLSPDGYGAGLWGSGAGLPIDTDAPGGRMFVVTGNGQINTNYPPYSTNGMAQSVVDFSLANGGITPTDEFTAFNAQDLNDGDLDLGSGGLLMVPDQNGTSTPHLLVVAGKEGRILVLNRDKLGGFAGAGASSDTNILQDIPNQIKGLWSTPAYWNGYVYIWGSKDVPKAFPLTDGEMTTTPSSQSNITSQFPGASFSISSNGSQDGIAWAVRSDQFNTDGPEVLYAWDATDLTTPIYESDTNAARDSAGPANKFAIPLVTNGKVYVPAHGEVDVYGLFNGEPTAAAPVISPNGGSFGSSQTVTLTSSTPSAAIFYTLDGSTPTPASTQYSGPITISTDSTLRAIASAPGYIQSAVSSAAFTFTDQTPPLTFSPAAGSYTTPQQVTIADTDTSAKIYYTTDGSKPSTSSTPYTGPINVGVSETINAVAVDSALLTSNIATAAYVIQPAGSSINFGSGFSTTQGLTLNGGAVATNDTRLQLTNGQLNEAGSVFWNTPINIQSFTTNFEFQLSLAQGNGFTFTIQNQGATAIGGDSAGLGYAGIPKSVAIKFNFYNYQPPGAPNGEGSDSTGLYTNGALPTFPTVDITPSGILLGSGDSIQAQVTYDGTTLTLNLKDMVTNDTFTYSWTVNIPQIVGGNTAYVGFTGGTGGLTSSQKLLSWTYATQAQPPIFSPLPGSYASAQSVSLTSGTSDAVIYYTTDGTTPNGSSPQYSGPIAVNASEKIQAVAMSPSLGESQVETGAYTIGAAAAGTFSLSAGAAAAIDPGQSASSAITVTPSGGFTGTVTLSCAVTSSPSGAADAPVCIATQPGAISGTTAVSGAVNISTQAGTTPGDYTVTVTGVSGGTTQTVTVPIDVTGSTTAASPSFALSSTAVSIALPATSGTSTITVTPSGGFTGTVALSCAVTSSPSSVTVAPTCTVKQPPAISGTAAVTGTLTFNVTAATSAAVHYPLQRILRIGGGGTLAALFFLIVPVRRRKGQAFFAVLLCLVVAGAASGCGVGTASKGTGTGTGTGTVTTTSPAGSYTVTVTGTSGSITATTKVAVTVQ